MTPTSRKTAKSAKVVALDSRRTAREGGGTDGVALLNSEQERLEAISWARGWFATS